MGIDDSWMDGHRAFLHGHPHAKHAIITPPLVAGLSMIDPVLLRSQPAQLAIRLRETRGFDLDVELLERLEAERKQLQVRTQ